MVPEGSQSIVNCASLADELACRYWKILAELLGFLKRKRLFLVFECVLSTTAKSGHDNVFEASALRDLLKHRLVQLY